MYGIHASRYNILDALCKMGMGYEAGDVVDTMRKQGSEPALDSPSGFSKTTNLKGNTHLRKWLVGKGFSADLCTWI
ncbi:hypothetical protein V6N11_068408 [Hibiscus sabdariffa]|uniref:Pentatricopeptide repeat-containing protein n=1 Tax=Hibiscus sabdariffa TaxID=183260 RepID=A0ABR1ZL10_9ROSI